MTIDSAIISKVFDGSITKQELLTWKDDRGHNLWHILSNGKNDLHFFQICNKVTEQELKTKLNERNELGDTPLHIAAWSNAVKVVDYLLNEQNIDFNKYLDNQGRTIAFIATEMNHTQIIDTCFQKGVDLNLLNNKGKNLKYYAASYDNQHCLNLIKKVSNLSEEVIDISSTGGSDEIIDFFQAHKHSLRGQKHF